MVHYNQMAIFLLIFAFLPINAKFDYKSCSDIDGEDGDYIIKIGSSNVDVYCYDMRSDQPKTYISLTNDQTYSTYYVQRQANGLTNPPTTTVETRFSKLRFDPLTMKVHTGDYTFAETSGYYIHNCGQGGCIGTVGYVPVGVAKDCEYHYTQMGRAKIDLAGTPFSIATEWDHFGWKSGGSSSFSSDNQVADIRGGGFCGWSAPTTVGDDLEKGGRGGWFLCLCLTGSDECNAPCEVDNTLPMGPIVVKIENYQSCADINGNDGDYRILIGDTLVDVYCYDMNSKEPKTYISLPNDQTFSTYYVEPGSIGPTDPPTSTVKTVFSKLRFDPLTMKVHTGDYTFAETSGYYDLVCEFGGCIENTAYVPVGVAKDCEGSESKLGTAKIDLRGTPFALATEWDYSREAGNHAAGSSFISSDNQVVNIQGGGWCGWSAPSPVVDNVDGATKGGWFLCLCLTGNDDCNIACEVDIDLPMGPLVNKREYYSCADIDDVADGDYKIRIGSSLVDVYCYDMDSEEPKTYITVAIDQTYSIYYAQREASSWTNPPTSTVKTIFSKLRFDPLTMKVHTGDYTFAETSGYYSRNCDYGGCIGNTAYVPVGVGKDCEGSRNGVARIDLKGTPFSIATEWSYWGYDSSGTFSFSSNKQVANIQGGGWCGWSGPTPIAGNGYWVAKGGWFICLCLTESEDCSKECIVDTSLPMGPIVNEKVINDKEYHNSCSEIDGEDGDYTIKIGSLLVDVYCHDMKSEEPKTYISLSNDQTYSSYYIQREANSFTNPPTTTIETRFSKLRFDPFTLKVHTGDYTFAETSGYYINNCGSGACIGNTAYVPVGVAKDCESHNSQEGRAFIDLKGTPFSIATEWSHSGWNSGGSYSLSSDDQVADIRGGGFCGWSAPTPVIGNAEWVGRGGWFLCLCVTGSDECNVPCEIDNSLPTGPIVVKIEEYQSCANIDGDDGEYKITIGDTLVDVYCYDMNSEEPKTYIPLSNDQTYSTYYVEPGSIGPTDPPTSTVKTVFSKLRFDPLTMKVHTGDYTFAETSGYYDLVCEFGGCIDNTAYVPVGVAKDCEASGSMLGTAKIDLRGTPFALATAFDYSRIGGVLAAGSSIFSSNNQVVDLQGGGVCGWSAPTPIVNDINVTTKGAWVLCLCLTGDEECNNECDPDGSNSNYIPMGPLVYKKEPESCADINGEDDGDYMIRIGSSTVDVYCYDMRSEDPKTYISLVNNETYSSYYVEHEASSQTYPPTANIVTRFSKLRFDPLTMKVHTSDYTFAETTGYHRRNCDYGGCIGNTAYVPVGVAKDCEENYSQRGRATIDLRGTPFSVATEFTHSGWKSASRSEYSYNNQLVNIQGGGYCGLSAPTAIAGNGTWATRGGWFLCLCLTESEECSKLCVVNTRLPLGPVILRTKDTKHYRSCADIEDDNDGDYTITIGSTPVEVYCFNMNTDDPKTYIKLANDQTYSTYYAGSEGTKTIETRFSKLRFDPSTMRVFTGDYTFAETSGYSQHNCEYGGCIGTTAYVPVGVAKDCEGFNSDKGTAKIDLTGTPFSVATAWGLGGNLPGGGSTFSSSNQVVDIQGGGGCGWAAPTQISADVTWVTKGGWFLCLCLTGSEACDTPCELFPLGPVNFS